MNWRDYLCTRFIYVLLFALHFVGCAPDKADHTWFNGQWEGLGYQLNLDKDNTWTIQVNIDFDKQVFHITYPSLECSGDWKLVKYSDNYALFDEIILNNTANCTEKGTIILTKVDNNHISYNYYYLDQKTVSCFSTLKRN